MRNINLFTLTICFCLISFHGFSQIVPISTVYSGNRYGQKGDAFKTSSGEILIAGSIEEVAQFPSSDFMLMKVDSTSNVLWAKTYPWPDRTSLSAVIETGDGNYLVLGNGEGSNRSIACKTDPTGNALWARELFPTPPNLTEVHLEDAMETSDGNLLLGGYYIADSIQSGYLVKTDSVGLPMWSRQIVSSGAVRVSSLSESQPGAYTVSFSNLDSNQSSFIYIYDVNGDSLDAAYFSSQQLNLGIANMTPTSDHGNIACGSMDGDPLLIKLDSSGGLEWSQVYPSDGQEFSQVEPQGNGYIAVGNLFYNGEPGQIICQVDGQGLAPQANGIINGSFTETHSLFIQAGNKLFILGNQYVTGSPNIYTLPFLIETDFQGLGQCPPTPLQIGTTSASFGASLPTSSSPVLSMESSINLISQALQVSMNTFCSPVAIEAPDVEESYFHCFPNPTSGNLEIQTSHLPSGSFEVAIFDNTGRQLTTSAEFHNGRSFNYDLPESVSGLVYLRFTQDGKPMETKKVMVLR